MFQEKRDGPPGAAPEASNIDAVIAARVRAIRTARNQTLDALAAQSGVSRAMLSRIERGESSPTAGLLVRLCGGLGVTLASLMDADGGGADAGPPPVHDLARREDQRVWRDPSSGYLWRAVSPAGTGSQVAIVEVEVPSGGAVLFEPLDRADGDRHVWVLDGAVEVASGASGASGASVASGGGGVFLGRGDCLRLAPDGPTGFRNSGPRSARCAVVTGRTGGRRGAT